MKLNPLFFAIPFLLLLLVPVTESKDLYKILGVEKNASQRDIQKAFHRQSLKYHPDKNPDKNAKAKFEEINNAYEVLSDEEKRKNYDLYGDDQGRPGGPQFGADSNAYAGSPRTGSQGYHFTYTTTDNSDSQSSFFNFPFSSGFGKKDASYSFSFSGHGGSFQNIFDNFFGTAQGRYGEQQQFSRYGDRKGKSSTHDFEDITNDGDLVVELTPKVFQKDVLGQSYTWAILYTDGTTEVQQRLKLLGQISNVLRGSIKVGHINCKKYRSFCEEQNVKPAKVSKLHIYSLRRNAKLTALEYTGDWSEKDLKNYCVEALPKFSKHLENINDLDAEDVPQVILLTRKKEAPAIWRALSGLFNGRINFFHYQVQDDRADAIRKQFNVDSFPAIVGIYGNGNTKVLRSGDKPNSSLDDLKFLLEEFYRKHKSSGSGQKRTKTEGEVIILTKNNFQDACSQDIPLCLIGVYKLTKDADNMKQILKDISQKSLVRRGQRPDAIKTPVNFSILDGTKQASFLKAFDESLAKGKDAVLIAYKPKKGTFVFHKGPLTLEKSENFVTEVLSGSLQLKRVKRDPKLE